MIRRRLLAVTALVYTLAWLLPSMVGSDLSGPYVARGWNATTVVLMPFLNGVDRTDPLWPIYLFLVVGSPLTNVLFLVAFILALRWPHRVSALWEGAVWLAALLNMHWFISLGSSRSELRAGYYLWVASFVLLAVALRMVRRAGPVARMGRSAA